MAMPFQSMRKVSMLRFMIRLSPLQSGGACKSALVVLGDSLGLTGGFGINRHGMFGGERQITFNGQAQLATNGTKFREADTTEFGEALTEVA